MTEPDLAARTVRLLADNVSGGQIGGDPQVRRVYELVAGRVRLAGDRGTTLDRFLADPANGNSRTYLTMTMRAEVRDPRFATALDAAVNAAVNAAVDAAARSAAEAEQHRTGPTVLAADRSIGVGGDFTGNLRMDNRTDNRVSNRRTTIGSGGPAILIVAAIAIVLGIAVWNAVGGFFASTEITADTRCRDYLAADLAARDEAVKRIGLELKIDEAGHPWMVNSVDYSCGQAPGRTLREVLGG